MERARAILVEHPDISEKQRMFLSCPDSVAEGARFETPDALETIGPDLTVSALSQPFTKARGR